MIDFVLAQSSQSDTITTVGAVIASVLLALGGREGIAAIHQKRRRTDSVTDEQCAERRAASEKQQDIHFQTLMKRLEDVRDSVGRLHDRIDELYKSRSR